MGVFCLYPPNGRKNQGVYPTLTISLTKTWEMYISSVVLLAVLEWLAWHSLEEGSTHGVIDAVGGIPVAHEDNSLFRDAVAPHQVIRMANISLDLTEHAQKQHDRHAAAAAAENRYGMTRGLATHISQTGLYLIPAASVREYSSSMGGDT